MKLLKALLGICCGVLLIMAGRFFPVDDAAANSFAPTDRRMITGETGIVASVVDGDTLFLDSGLKVRIAGMQAPKLSLGRPHVKDWPLGPDSKIALSDMVLGKRVRLSYGGLQRDRHGRALAQVYVLNDKDQAILWVQEQMIKTGMARLYTWPDTWQDTDRLIKAERRARDARLGLWAHKKYAVRGTAPDALAQDVDSFQLVQGVVTSVADKREFIYINFGSNYKTDFTVAIARKDKRRILAAGLDPMSLEGAMVRVRGWIEMTNGPLIWLDHAERLEVLGE